MSYPEILPTGQQTINGQLLNQKRDSEIVCYGKKVSNTYSDTNFITSDYSAVHTALKARSRYDMLRRTGDLLKKINLLAKLKGVEKYTNIIGRSAPIINVLVGVSDATKSYRQDLLINDQYRSNTTRSIAGTVGSIILGGAATISVGAVGMAALPAAALVLGAGYTGSEMGSIIGERLISLRKYWDSHN
jgi:hypothetical protein